MGRVKEWAMSEQLCAVCGREFLPMTVGHDIDLATPTCSDDCYRQYHQVMNELADIRESEPPEPL